MGLEGGEHNGEKETSCRLYLPVIPAQLYGSHVNLKRLPPYLFLSRVNAKLFSSEMCVPFLPAT